MFVTQIQITQSYNRSTRPLAHPQLNIWIRDVTVQEFEAILTEDGQVTIPHEIRQLLGLQPRDLIHFEVAGEEVRIRRATSKLLSGFGSVTPIQRPEDFHNLREEFEKGVAEDVTKVG